VLGGHFYGFGIAAFFSVSGANSAVRNFAFDSAPAAPGCGDTGPHNGGFDIKLQAV
jgi:hypothetical protein